MSLQQLHLRRLNASTHSLVFAAYIKTIQSRKLARVLTELHVQQEEKKKCNSISKGLKASMIVNSRESPPSVLLQ